MRKTLTAQNLQTINLQTVKSQYPEFLHHVQPFLAAVKLENYSASKLFEILREDDNHLVQGHGYVRGRKILEIIRFLHETAYSDICSKTQIRNASISSAVPIVLASYRTQRGVGYNSWDREDPYMQFLLPQHLSWLLNPQPVADCFSLLEDFLTNRTTGEINPVTHHKSAKTGVLEFDSLPKYQKYMYLQTWIYHPGVRHADMITDWADWDALRPSRHGTQLAKPWDDLLPQKPVLDW